MAYSFYNFHGIKASYIHISDVCNFRCKTCRLPVGEKASFVPLEIVKQKLRIASRLNLKNFIFTGQEVLLHPDISEIVRFSCEDCRADYITFNTNGLAFCDKKAEERLGLVKEYMDKVYIAVSINFFDAVTFNDFSGCQKSLFERWYAGVKEALNKYPKILLDTILRRDIDITKVLDFLSKLSCGRSRQMNLRVLDLMPFRLTSDRLYKKLKPKLTEVTEIIPEILKRHKGKVEFESFPICAYNQKHLKEKRHYFYNFHVCYESSLPIQYDPNIYQTYFKGPTENWAIDRDKLQRAYKRMFVYLDECEDCYYRNQCYGIQREYIKIYSKKQANREINLLKRINWV